MAARGRREGGRGRGGRRGLFSAVKVPDDGVWFCLRSRLPHCRGQWCSHLTVARSHAETPMAVLRRTFSPGRN